MLVVDDDPFIRVVAGQSLNTAFKRFKEIADKKKQVTAMDREALVTVDDDPFIRKLIATTLEEVAAIELHEAGDGIEAIEVARARRPTLVFLDVDIPALDGIDACRGLRENPVTREATIVMRTAAHGDSVERRAEEAGADLFPTKPFSPLDLLRLVDRLSGPAR